MENISLDEAFRMVDQVLAAYKGNRQEHVTLVTAINVIKEATVPKELKEKKESKKYVPSVPA